MSLCVHRILHRIPVGQIPVKAIVHCPHRYIYKNFNSSIISLFFFFFVFLFLIYFLFFFWFYCFFFLTTDTHRRTSRKARLDETQANHTLHKELHTTGTKAYTVKYVFIVKEYALGTEKHIRRATTVCTRGKLISVWDCKMEDNKGSDDLNFSLFFSCLTLF